jgi:hypothetical protein
MRQSLGLHTVSAGAESKTRPLWGLVGRRTNFFVLCSKAMEAVVAAGETRLISGIDFKLSPTAPYVQSRRLLRLQPTSGNVFSPGSGLSTMRFVVGGSNEWLDGSTVRIAMTLRNQSVDNQNPAQPAAMTALTPSAATMFSTPSGLHLGRDARRGRALLWAHGEYA